MTSNSGDLLEEVSEACFYVVSRFDSYIADQRSHLYIVSAGLWANGQILL